MEQLKKGVFTTAQVVIWLTFISAIFDPGILGTRPLGNVFATYAVLVDLLYLLSGYIVNPVQGCLEQLGLYSSQGPDIWFPMTSAPEWHAMVTPLGWGPFFTPTSFSGAIIWWIPIASVVLCALSVAYDNFYEKVRNWAWSIIIEYVFQRKKTKIYQQALHKREQDMARLDTQYRALAQETHSLKDSVITDELTQVFNKRFFLSRLQQEFDLCKREKMLFTLIMIDIDYFKKLNDTYGHVAGDKVLKGVAEVLKRFAPDQCFPCRYGGEEFSIIMPRKALEPAVEAARLMQENIQQLRFEDIDSKLRVTISQGICAVDFSSPDAENINRFDEVLQLADQELYRSKVEGRNRVSVRAILNRPKQQQP